MAYTRARPNWLDFPNTTTPIVASMLNAWDQAIYDLKRGTVLYLSDYGADMTGAASSNTALTNAVADLPATGGTIVVSPGTLKASYTLTTNKRINLLGWGVTWKPPASSIGLVINQGNGASILGCHVEGFIFDGSNGNVTAIRLWNNDRAVLRNLRIASCLTGLEYYSDAGGWAEENALAHSLIKDCTTGIKFTKTTTGQGSFGENAIYDVGINNCTTGINCDDTTGVGTLMSLYRTWFQMVTLWVNANQTGVKIGCNMIGADWFMGFEDQGAGVGTVGVQTTANAVNTLDMNAQFRFDGPWANMVLPASGKDINWRTNTAAHWTTGGNGRGLTSSKLGDANPRVEIVNEMTGGGGILFGTGGGTAWDIALYRLAADILALDDDFAINVAGKGLKIKEGTNAKMGVATLVAGTVVVSNTSVTANSHIFLDVKTPGGTPGWLRVSARTAGTSFTILSSSGTDTSVVGWMMVEPA